MSDKMREDFESYVKNNFICSEYSFKRTNTGVYYNYVYSKSGNYDSCSVNSIWELWQASRAALVVELPSHVNDMDSAPMLYDSIVKQLREAGIRYE